MFACRWKRRESRPGVLTDPSPIQWQQIAAVYALSFLRPRARRAASTLRPPLVAIRVRKP
jgi:hypothetical protein